MSEKSGTNLLREWNTPSARRAYFRQIRELARKMDQCSAIHNGWNAETVHWYSTERIKLVGIGEFLGFDEAFFSYALRWFTNYPHP